MPEINLLQGERRSGSPLRIALPAGAGGVLLWIMLGLLGLVLALWGGLWWWQQSLATERRGVQQQIAEVNTQLKSKADQTTEAVRVQGRLVTFKSLLDKHLYWTQLWKELGRATLKNIQYTAIQAASETGQFTVRGETESYTDVGRVMLGLQQSAAFSRVDLTSSGPAEGQKVGIKFEIAVKMKPSVLQSSSTADQPTPPSPVK